MSTLSRIPIAKNGSTQVGAVAHTENLPMKVEQTALQTSTAATHRLNLKLASTQPHYDSMRNNMDVTNFIALCDKSFREHPSTAPKSKDGYEAVYSEAREKISDPQDASAIVKRLSQELVIKHHRDKLDYEKYMPVLQSIREAARKDVKVTSSPAETDWPDLIKTIISNRSELHYFSAPPAPFLEAPLHNFARAYVFLENAGIKFIEINNELCISEESYDRINTLIDNICTSTGGQKLIAGLAKKLGKVYNPKLKRFTELRNVSPADKPRGAAIPFGYLTAIITKYSNHNTNKEHDGFEHLSQLITILVSTFEIQPKSQWETLHTPNEAILRFTRENILYDNLVGLHQTNHSYAKEFISYIHKEYQNRQIVSADSKLTDTTRTALSILSLAKTKSFKYASEAEIAKNTKIPKEKSEKIIKNLLSTPAREINKNLEFPPSSLNTDHYFKPAAATNKEYIIYPKSISALGCINAICRSITHPNGKHSNTNETELGIKIEEFIRRKMTEKGINIIHGKQCEKGKDLEADMICEDEKHIYIFETKKKVLTREAQSGNEADVLKDLANSILATQFQAMRLEQELKKNGHLTLKNNNNEKTIYWKNRTIRRVSVSFHDFGAVQDKIFTMSILKAATQSNVHHPDPKEDKKLNDWRDKALQIQKIAKDSGEIGTKNKVPFYDSLAMSIPQIFTILENSLTPKEFFQHISYLVCGNTGGRSVYAEIANNQHLVEHSRTKVLVTEHQPDQSAT